MRILTLTILSAFLLTSCLSKYPSDDAMVKRFDKNRSSYESLLKEVVRRQDIRLVASDAIAYSNMWRETDRGNNVEPELQSAVRKLGLGEVRISRGEEVRVYFQLPNNSTLLTDLFGEYPYHVLKGYAYLPAPPLALVADLSAIDGDDIDGDSTYYEHIEGNWYLYLEADES